MSFHRLMPFLLKQAIRRPVRTLLTVSGVAMAMFVFAAVESLRQGAAEATTATARETNLIVYQANRFCPAASRLPESYADRIARIPGVVDVVPVKVVPTNCRTSLDVITFRGVPADIWARGAGSSLYLKNGSLGDWLARKDSAILGEALARRRGLKPGDQFDAAGVRVVVAGTLRAEEPQDWNVAYVHLDFLQRTTGQRTLGVVTQFDVKVDDPSRLDAVAAAIDQEFRNAQQPTHTSSEKGFIARAAADIVNLVGFLRILGWGCVAAVLALIGNAVVLNVQDRIRDHAILQTVGFTQCLVARLVMAEGLLLGLAGGGIGAGLAVAAVRWSGVNLSNEGISIPLTATAGTLAIGLGVSALVGVLASLVPAWQVSRREIPACFQAV